MKCSRYIILILQQVFGSQIEKVTWKSYKEEATHICGAFICTTIISCRANNIFHFFSYKLQKYSNIFAYTPKPRAVLFLTGQNAINWTEYPKEELLAKEANTSI